MKAKITKIFDLFLHVMSQNDFIFFTQASCVTTSGQSVHGIRGHNFLFGKKTTEGFTLRVLEYICVLSTVLADIF